MLQYGLTRHRQLETGATSGTDSTNNGNYSDMIFIIAEYIYIIQYNFHLQAEEVVFLSQANVITTFHGKQD